MGAGPFRRRVAVRVVPAVQGGFQKDGVRGLDRPLLALGNILAQTLRNFPEKPLGAWGAMVEVMLQMEGFHPSNALGVVPRDPAANPLPGHGTNNVRLTGSVDKDIPGLHAVTFFSHSEVGLPLHCPEKLGKPFSFRLLLPACSHFVSAHGTNIQRNFNFESLGGKSPESKMACKVHHECYS